jgi:uncharacterized protein YjbJ (UPF0337 family)
MELSQIIASLCGSMPMQKGCPYSRKIKNLKENSMKSSTQDKAEGKFHEVKGKVKEVAGKVSDNPKLEAEGTVEKITGHIQEKVGQVKKVWGQ